jgi:hypothetical protein
VRLLLRGFWEGDHGGGIEGIEGGVH